MSQNLIIAGVDEAGRGSLVGPVLAAAVILNPLRPIDGLADSKTLSANKRLQLSSTIKLTALSWSIAAASADEIDELNILQATLIAMQRAVSGLAPQPDHVLIDGNQIPKLSIPAQAIVKGDNIIPAISAASILAKVERDRLMMDYYKKYPNFLFHRHKGYGTKQHLAEIERFGYLEIHRKSFNPVKSLFLKQT